VTRQRLTVQEAAEILGTSVDAVRMRVKRGTLRSEKGEDGRVYVWVNVNPDVDQNTVHPTPQVEAYRELIDELRDRVRSLEEANRENRRIIAALTQRIPELEATASPEPPGGSETAAEEPQRVEPRSGTGGPQAPSDRPRDTAEFPVGGGSLTRPWWRRVFGG
jgi:excisionase family DNA binding protein